MKKITYIYFIILLGSCTQTTNIEPEVSIYKSKTLSNIENVYIHVTPSDYNIIRNKSFYISVFIENNTKDKIGLIRNFFFLVEPLNFWSTKTKLNQQLLNFLPVISTDSLIDDILYLEPGYTLRVDYSYILKKGFIDLFQNNERYYGYYLLSLNFDYCILIPYAIDLYMNAEYSLNSYITKYHTNNKFLYLEDLKSEREKVSIEF